LWEVLAWGGKAGAFVKIRMRPHKRLSSPDCPDYILKCFTKCLASGKWGPGRRARTLEGAIARKLDIPETHVVATISYEAANRIAQNMTLLPAEFITGGTHFLAPEHKELLQQEKIITYDFGPTAEISCITGGALCFGPQDTTDTEVLERVRRNNRFDLMPDPLAAWIREDMKRLPDLRAKRRKLLALYKRFLGEQLVEDPETASGHSATLEATSRELRELWALRLERYGIQCKRHGSRRLKVPLHVAMLDKDVKYICWRIISV